MMHHHVTMRTTVTIADHLLLDAKRLAARRRTSLARVVEDSLRKYLAEQHAEAEDSRQGWSLPVLDGGPVAPGVDLDDTSALWELV